MDSSPSPSRCWSSRNADECDCDHTMHIHDAHGNRRGSWVDQYAANRWRVVCGGCGRFYGYLVAGYESKAPGKHMSTARSAP